MNKNLTRLRRTMMFLSAQKPGLIKDAYIYKPDSLIFDLEDAVAENQKDAARFSLYHALTAIDYRGVERIVRINALDTPHWRDDIRAAVAAGADGIRIAKCERASDVRTAVQAIEEDEARYHRPLGQTLVMAALESPLAILNAYEICCACKERMIGVALSGGDYRKCMQTAYSKEGDEIYAARANMLIAARAAGVQCFDTVFTDLDDQEGFEKEVQLIKRMGFDGKSLISPKQIAAVHRAFTPSVKEIMQAEAIVRAYEENVQKGIGVFTVNSKMIDIAFVPGAQRILNLAKASGVYQGELQ